MEIKQKIRSQSVKTKKATRIKERGDIAVKNANISVKTIRRGIRGASVAAQKGKLIAQKTNGYGSVHESANETEYAVTYLEKASGHLKEKAQSKATEKSASMTKWSTNIIKDTVKGKMSGTAASNVSFKSASGAVKTGSVPFKTATNKTGTARRYTVSSVRKARKHAERSKAFIHKSKRAAKGAKSAVNTLAAALKKIALALKSFLLFLITGGWLVLVVVLFAGLIAALIGSVLGIFFGNGSEYNGENLSYAMSEITTEYYNRIADLAGGEPYDQTVIKINGSTGTDMNTVWKQVLAVYSVRVSTGDNASMPIDFSDPYKMEMLKKTFFDMVSMSGSITTTSEEVPNSEGETAIIEKKVLSVEVTTKNALDMIGNYSFNSEQRELLDQMISPDMDDAWRELLYGSYGNGIVSANGDIVETAISQLGNIGGQPFWSWYGFSSRVEWCACFVSWCADQNGFITAGVIPKFSYCDSGIAWFKEKNLWKDGGYEPVSGNIIFFDWNGDGVSDHVGIVEYTMNGVVHTIEGNSGDACARMSYVVGSSVIMGYGTPFYEQATLQ